jgi:phage recombination protein Bet
MADAAAVQTIQSRDEITEQMIHEYVKISGLGNNLSNDEVKQFTRFCTSYQLDPFRGEVYCSVYGSGDYRNLSIIVSFLTYVKRAELSGRLDGWSAEIEGTGEDTEAVVTIWRKDWSHEFQHRVHWKEAVQRKKDGSLTHFWKKMPRYLLKKTAIAQAFRLAFPAELAGMGFDEAELPEEMTQNKSRGNSNPNSPAAQKGSDFKENAHMEEDNVLPFTSQKEKGSPTPSQVQRSTEDLVSLINKILSTNNLAFPTAHIRWVQKELAKNPPRERLEEIIQHMNSILGDKSTKSTAPVSRDESTLDIF